VTPDVMLTFAVLGLGAGAMYAGLALGVILTYRGSGVVNFANGALALFIAYIYFGLTTDGAIIVPPLPNPLSMIEGIAGWFGIHLELWDIPSQVTLADGGMTLWLAALISLAIAVFIGWLIHVAIFRPLRTASPLTKVVASVGLMLLLQGIIVVRFGPDFYSTNAILPTDVVQAGTVIMTADRLWIIGGAIALTVLLAAVFKFTYFGIATRASAENERAAILIGLSPNRLAGFNWMISSLIAGIAGIVFSSISGLNPTDFVLMIIPALGAALIARFSSFAIAAAAAFGIGVLQSVILPMQAEWTWLPSAGLAAGVPFFVLAITMVTLGVGLPTRATASHFKLPRATRPSHPRIMTAILGGLAAVLIVFLPFDWRAGLINSLAFIVVAVSLYVIVGLAGQVSLMQMAIVGFTALAMTRIAGDMGLPFPISPLLAIAVGTAFGVLTGLFALRVRGVELAVLTLSAAWAFEAMVIENQDILRDQDQAGAIPSPTIFGFDFGPNVEFPFGGGGTPGAWFGLFVLIVTVGCVALAIWVRNHKIGLRFLAMRSNERAAAALGINLRTNKLLAIGISAAIASVSGVLYSYRFSGLTPTSFVALASVVALAAAFIGGISMISGTIVAGIGAVAGLYSVFMEHLIDYGDVEVLVGAFLLILIAVQQPEGVAGFNEQAFYHLRAKYRKRKAHRRAEPRLDGGDQDGSPALVPSRIADA